MQEIDHHSSESNCSTLAEEMHASKKRKVAERTVVAVKIQGNDKRQHRNEGPPSDCWSWRKYGQKPIKGSPYPRGYYKCSTSKGCSAKKQVERCKTDASMLIITYTSTHNHPGPDSTLATNHKQDPDEINEEITDDQPTTPKQEQEAELTIPDQETNGEDRFQYSQSPFNSNQEDSNFQENLETSSVLYDQDPKPFTHGGPMEFSSEENDFFDELEELPSSSFFKSFMRSSFCKDRSIVNPS
ncbi:hypothetical protein ABFS82_04G007300 [Erythranthe guttata]|uniref:WRKY domain-containing protein n=1 Tax=Erythranthe guttata TaxID=4155 RepID=A0A022S217_ERYGU|nr:PREDICTED: probable WRKY transcription factor 35 [Erythranthe guttata]EYU46812.1 hypothetical protein MIMGU_mgv1a012761mg [Erythranthe guttata]|eukprot:XP_012834230.1 PREDICTED: probable WRKY transcription factor 35 [Erythranthe guttata]